MKPFEAKWGDLMGIVIDIDDNNGVIFVVMYDTNPSNEKANQRGEIMRVPMKDIRVVERSIRNLQNRAIR